MKAFYRLLYFLSILSTGILSGITLAGAFVGDFSPATSRLMPFIGIALPLLLLANATSAIYWIIRRRCWLILPLIALLGNWNYLSSVVKFPPFSTASQPKEGIHPRTPGIITVATYNVNRFNNEHTGFSCKEIADYMKHLNVDIICFQEFGINNEFGIDSLSNAFAEWPYSFIPASPAGKSLLQLAVYSRYPIQEQQLITYANSNNCSLWCDITINSKTIRLFNNHLQTTEVTRNKRKLEKEFQADNSDQAELAAVTLVEKLHDNFKKRASQAEQIHQYINNSPYPILACGDFNSIPSSYVYHTIKGSKLQDGFKTSGHGYMYTFRYFKHLLRIDYILHSPELKGLDYYSPQLPYSDHNPVVMKIAI